VASPFPEKGGTDGGIKARASCWFKQTKHKQTSKHQPRQDRETHTMKRGHNKYQGNKRGYNEYQGNKRGYNKCQEGGWNEEPLPKKERRANEKVTLPLDVWTVIVPFCDNNTWKKLSQAWREIRSLRENEYLMIHRKRTVPKNVKTIKQLKAYLRTMHGTLFNLSIGPLECLLKANIDEDLAQYFDKTRILEIHGCGDIDHEAFWYLRGVRELKLLHCKRLSSRSFAPLKQLKKLTLRADIIFTEQTFQDLENLEILHVVGGLVSLNIMDGIRHMKNLRQLKLPYYEWTRDQIFEYIGRTIEIL
jgi:hypothetical protein